MTASSISVEAHALLVTTIPGIGPDLFQKKQVYQANENNARLLLADRPRGAPHRIIGMTYSAPAPARRR
jgi:hypothetical protein